jgi:hypothetical protein
MRRFLRALTPLTAMLVSVGLVAGNTPASATGSTVAAVRGSGTISPGLSTTPTNQAVTFDGALTGAGTFSGGGNTAAGVSSNLRCTFSGTGVGETATLGGGSGTVTCDSDTGGNVTGVVSPGNQVITRITFSCNVNYTRVGGVVRLTGMCTIVVYVGATAVITTSGTVRGAFVFEPRDVNPTRSYDLTGESQLDDTTCPTGTEPGCV